MKRFYLILFATLLSWQLFSQVSIGDGTGTSGAEGPIYPYYNYSYFQTIYKASDINASGDITSIQYEMEDDNAISNTDDNIDVWIGHTDKTVFDDSNDWIDVSTLTQVLTNGSLVKTGTSVSITFSSPFSYNGTDNLVIAINAKEPGCEGFSDAFYYTEGSYDEHPTICRYSDDNVIDVNNPSGQGMYSFCYPNITLMGIGSSCPFPTALTASDISTTSAEINWTENGTATNWNIEYGPEGFTQGSGTSLSVTSKPYILNGLTSATNYDVYIQSDCGEGELSSWQGALSFATDCPTAISPDYVASLSVTPPICWSEANDGTIDEGPSELGSSDWREGVGFINESGNAVYSNSITIYSNEKRDWLISPSFDLSGGNFELKTIVAYTAWNSSGVSSEPATGSGMGNDDKVSVLISTDNGLTWTEIHTWVKASQPAPTGTEDIIDLSAYSGTVKFAIFATDGDVINPGMNDFHLGHFEVRESSATCYAPSNITISDITTSTANISWTAPTSTPTNGYEYYYTTDNTLPTNTTVASGTTNNTTASLSGLNAGTQYYVWVRSVCSNTDKSAWSSMANFTTSSESSNYTVTFNVTDGTNALENASIFINGQTLMTNNNGVATIEVPNGNYPYTVNLDNYEEKTGTVTVSDADETINITMISTAVETCDMPTNITSSDVTNTTATISWIASTPAPANGYKVKLYNSVTYEVTYTTTQNTSKVLSGLTAGTTYYVYVRSICGTDSESDWTESINFTTVEGATTCDTPTSLASSEVMATTATISWTAPANASANSYELKLYNSVTHEVTYTATQNTSKALSGLTEETTYYVYVRSICGTDSESDWTPSINFTTLNVGIDNIENSASFKYFPNPVKDILKISAQDNIERVEIYDMNKTKVYDNAFNSTQITINFNYLSSGTYLIRAIINNNVENFKVVKL